MIIEGRLILIFALVVTKVESHIEEELTISCVNLHFRCGKTVNKPINGIVFMDTIVDEFSLVSWDVWYNTESPTNVILFEHINLCGTRSVEENKH